MFNQNHNHNHPDFDTILDDCLIAVQAGASVESCLAQYPDQAEALRPLLATVQAVERIPVPRQRAAAVSAGRTKMLAALAEQKATPAVSLSWLPRYAQRMRNFFSFKEQPMKRIPSILVGLVILLFGSTFIVAASNNSLPGEPLYPVKQIWQGAQRILTFNPVDRQTLEIDQNETRYAEIREVMALGRPVIVEFDGLIQEMTATEWLVADFRLLVDAATNIKGQFVVGDQVHVQARVVDQTSLLSLAIEPGQLPLILMAQSTPTPTPCGNPNCGPQPTDTPTPHTCPDGTNCGTPSPTPTPCNTPNCATLTPTPCTDSPNCPPTATPTPCQGSPNCPPTATPTPCQGAPNCLPTPTPCPMNANCVTATATATPTPNSQPTATPCNTPACAPPTLTPTQPCNAGACPTTTSTPLPPPTATPNANTPTPTSCSNPNCAPPTLTPTPGCNTGVCSTSIATSTPLPPPPTATQNANTPSPTPCNTPNCNPPTVTPPPTPTQCSNGNCLPPPTSTP